MKVCVFGAGAIGGAVAARLASSGVATSVVARGSTLAAIRAHGVRFDARSGSLVARVAASDRPETLGPQDVVITAVKAQDLPGCADAIATLLHERTAVVYALNGIPWWYFHRAGGPQDGRRLERLDPAGALWDRVGVARAVGCVINLSCSVTAPGVVHQDGINNRFALGEPDGSDTDRLREIAAVVRAAGIEVSTGAPIRQEVWTKLRRIVATSAVTGLTGLTSGAAAGDPTLRPILRAAMLETNALAAAYGVALDDEIDAHLRQQASNHHKPSLLQDLEAGRRVEIDGQMAVPLDLARAAGVPVPTIEMLVALLVARARAAGLYAG